MNENMFLFTLAYILHLRQFAIILSKYINLAHENSTYQALNILFRMILF